MGRMIEGDFSQEARRDATGWQSRRPLPLSYRRFLGYAFIAVAVATVPFLLWNLASVLLLGFGAVLIACLLQVVAEPFQRWTPLPDWLSLTIAGLLVMSLFASAAWVFGSQLGNEFSDLAGRIESASQTVQTALSHNEAGRYLLDQIQGTDLSVTMLLRRVFAVSVSSVEALLVVVISAVYLVVQPQTYRRGLVLLFPAGERDRIDRTLEEVGRALRLWMIGQLIQMAVIGALSTIAVWLLGLPSVLALGLIATVTEFVPYLGPIAAAIPAVLVALSQSPSTALWTLAAYIIIHQVEGNILTPLVEKRLIFIPPALVLLGIAAIGTLLGIAGVIFAAPIVVTVYVAVKQLYVKDILGEKV